METRNLGIGWDIQQFALEQYYLVDKYPEMFDREMVLRVVNYVLGCHPGSGTSLVSGVGSHSVTVAFGLNRDMEYYIPGGMVSERRSSDRIFLNLKKLLHISGSNRNM